VSAQRVAFVAAAFVIGAALGVGLGLSPAPVEELSGTTSVLGEDGDSPVVAPRRAAGRLTASQPVPDAGALSAALVDELRAELAPAQRSPAPGCIVGSVHDRDRKPLAGVSIVAEAIPRAIPGAALTVTDADPAVAWENAIRAHLEAESRRRAAISDAAGAFRLEGIEEDREYSVRAHGDGFALRGEHGDAAERAVVGATLGFIGERVVDLVLEVVSEDGSALTAARIRIEDCEGHDVGSQVWTAQRPVISLSPGCYSLIAYGDELGGCSLPLIVRLPLTRGTERPRLVVESSCSILGRLEFTAGEPGFVLDVCALRRRDAAAPTWQTFRYGESCQAGGRSPAFCFDDLAPGRWTVAAFADQRLLAHAEVELEGGPTSVNLAVGALSRGDATIVRVLDPAGGVVWNAAVWDELSGEDATARGDGSYLLRGGPPPGLPVQDSAFLIARAAGLGAMRAEYRRSSGADVVVRFEPPSFLTVHLDAGRTQVAREEVNIEIARATGLTWVAQRVKAGGEDAGGPYEIEGVQPGPYELQARVSFANSWFVVRQAIVLPSGGSTAKIVLPQTHVVEVELTGAQEDAYVWLTALDGVEGNYAQRALRTEDGRLVVRFERVLAGRYACFKGDQREQESMILSVPAAGRLHLDARCAMALVALESAGGALASLGLEPHDRIEGAAGSTFARNPRSTLLMLAVDGARIDLAVRRADRTLRVGVDGAALRALIMAGGLGSAGP
jgi:hypothetical protein